MSTSPIFEGPNLYHTETYYIRLDRVAFVRGTPKNGICVVIPGVEIDDGPCLLGENAERFLTEWRKYVGEG